MAHGCTHAEAVFVAFFAGWLVFAMVLTIDFS
jgi:hypothetical protein